MADAPLAPIAANARIGELDIIRGLALFGVLWVNMYGYTDYIVSADRIVHLWGEGLDRHIGRVTEWLAYGKAQALFSMLFGFGFAMMSDRIEARGLDAGRLYRRRILILLALGVAHFLLLWAGDILHAYALMGLVLMLTRRWPGIMLLGVGLILSLGTALAGDVWLSLITPEGRQPAVFALTDAGRARRWDVFLGHDYLAYVRELWAMAGPEFYGSPLGYVFAVTILGRFLLGAWIHRQGWMQDTARYATGFRRALPGLLVGGLVLAGVDPLIDLMRLSYPSELEILVVLAKPAGQLVLALGYGCGLVVLCQTPGWRRRLSGLGAVGQMALTNYLIQSVFFMLVLNGFGLGWVRYAGPTFCLIAAVVFFAMQIVFSRWWLARYRFGPAEWLWRWATYGQRQPFRRVRVDDGTATVA
ncbi:MAG TPA: DUF418 domain-containing protein [Brevundimonas sp.]|uniref:DUF418 domain-containing protein n=1 Tax=Brevundimonas sp. TaxID=1871086 RepID=UPI002604BF81|nr:DUF418 domain-containing protein [Brevundimonas sp.]HRO32779.1 DUF418 domain-containing protein [Brevundimonas sp.]